MLRTALCLCLLLVSARAQDGVADKEAAEYARRVTPEVEVVRKAGPAVVYIETDVSVPVGYNWFGQRIEAPGTSKGSGVVVFQDGYVVTNHHVIAGATKVRVQFDPQYEARQFDAEIVSSQPEEDLALLKISGDGPFPTVELGTSSDLMPGERVIAIGNPLGEAHTISAGIISGLHRQVTLRSEATPQNPQGLLRFENLIQTDASINPGNSGGPLLNINGKLIGINSAMKREAENIGFAIPVDRVKQVLEEVLLSAGNAPAWMGFALDESSLVLTRVWAGGPAAAAGLQAGDRLIELDGKRIETPEKLRLARAALRPRQKVSLSVRRAEQALPFELEPWERVEGTLFERLGLRPRPISIGRNLYSVQKRVQIAELRPDGPAAKLGLKVGDILDGLRLGCLQPYFASDNVKVASDAQVLAFQVSKLPAGCQIELDVLRDEDQDGRLERSGEHPELLRGTLTVE